MKKIKITEKQARLLETLNSKKVLKVTKEQYNRIIESELNRPSLTETPELHEEEINEDLFREFVNELYGLNEEGAECKYDKLNRVMEAAGLIEGGKLVKEKFGKDARKVKEVVGKGLMKYEECGSVYEAVQYMEEAINRVEPEVGSPAYNSRRDTIDQFGYDPDKGKYGDDIKNLVNDIETIYKNNEEESHSIIKDFLKIRSASKVSNLRQHDLKKLLKILEDKFVNPNQGSMELDENDLINEAPELNIDKQRLIKDIEPIESDEFNYNGLDKSTIVNFIKNGRPSEYYYNTIIDTMNKLLGTNHKLDDYKIERKPMNMTITDPSKYGINPRDYGPLDEFDSTMVGGSYEGPLNHKPAFKSNVESELTSKIYEALKKK